MLPGGVFNGEDPSVCQTPSHSVINIVVVTVIFSKLLFQRIISPSDLPLSEGQRKWSSLSGFKFPVRF